MQIPEALQHFSEPALIVTADHFHARLWLAFEDSMEAVESFEMPSELKSDNEGSFANMDAGTMNAPEPKTEEERLKRFVHVLADRVSQLIRDEEVAMALHILAPADVAHPFKKHLAPEAANILGKELDVNVMKEDEVQILERLVAA
ncbi:host attachment protein [Candidatus Uhrbacteria bacterium]|nr:host attachment protein [Candidatus Uhrbacteria bacterium]